MPYTYARPTVFPDLALNDVNNGLLGAPNVQEPPSGLKNDGWEYGQKPEREFFNWYGRITNNWIKYSDERITTILGYITTTEIKQQDAYTFFRNQS